MQAWLVVTPVDVLIASVSETCELNCARKCDHSQESERQRGAS